MQQHRSTAYAEIRELEHLISSTRYSFSFPRKPPKPACSTNSFQNPRVAASGYKLVGEERL